MKPYNVHFRVSGDSSRRAFPRRWLFACDTREAFIEECFPYLASIALDVRRRRERHWIFESDADD